MNGDFALGAGVALTHAENEREDEPSRPFHRAARVAPREGAKSGGHGQQREISFAIPGSLGGKGRPRFSTRGKFARAYTPEKTRSDEGIVRQYAHEAMKPLNGDLLHGPLEMTMHVIRVCPPSWSKRKKSGAKWITGKPDADNSLKLAGDAMNGIVYGDDSQISCVSFHRTYGTENSVHITVAELT